MVSIVQLSDLANPVQTFLVSQHTAERVAGVGRVGEQLPVPQPGHHLVDQPSLRVDRMDVEIGGHCTKVRRVTGLVPMSTPDQRQVTLTRVDTGIYEARNAKGATLRFGSRDEDGFSPVELLLAALAGCSAVDLDVVTARRTEPTRFEVSSSAQAVHGGDGNLLQDIEVRFTLGFPSGPDGDAARKVAPAAARASHDKTCTVSRTIEQGVPVTMSVELLTED